MLKRTIISATCVVTLFLAACGGGYAADISRNGNCEQIADGKLVGWAAYMGFGKILEWGSLAEGHSGKGVYFVPGDWRVLESGKRKGDKHINIALVQGGANGVTGGDAFVSAPHPDAKYYRHPLQTGYNIAFWVKSEASELQVLLQPWSTEEAAGNDRMGMVTVVNVPRTEEWTRYHAFVSLPGTAKRFALLFRLNGYAEDGLKLGRVCIDEVTIERATLGLTAEDLPRLEIPDDPAVYDGETPIEEVLAGYRASAENTIARVKQTLTQADAYAAKSDEWYRQYFAPFPPRGCYTVTCPIHPFKTRNYNWFEMSMDEPWKLVCKHCKAEGREYYYYPNPDYPDDGNGCRPTDEIWARDHDEAWTKAHRGIPHDHWNGTAYGEIGGGKAFHFLGHYYTRAMQTLIRKQVPTLALAYHYAAKLFPPGTEQHDKADLYAHKGKVILLSLARAHLGDDYLAAAEGITPAQFKQRIIQFYRPSESETWTYQKLPGFAPFKYTDAMQGDPLWEEENKQRPYDFRIFHGAWDRRADFAANLLNCFCLLRAGFDEDEADLCRCCQRVVVSLPGDKEKVAKLDDPVDRYLKRGSFEMEIHPFSLETGGNNLSYATQPPRLRAGQFTRNDAIIENVARDITYFFHNFFTQDGLSYEGSPSYTYAGYAITATMDKLYGLKGDFDEEAPWFDKELGAINMARMPIYKDAATRLVYCTTEDGYYIPWEDSYYGSGYFGKMYGEYARMEQYGGGIPEKERKYLNIEKTPDGKVTVTRNTSVPLPPILLNDRRKAILRAGRTETPAVVSLDFTKKCGHYHAPAQTLMVHACGQELASDLGYLGSDHFLTYEWIKTYPAHNCLTIRAGDGDPNGTQKLRGDLRKHFITTPFCQIVDTAEYDPADWQDSGFGDDGDMSRQVILMIPSTDHQYVIDISRARGGAIHDYYLHCHGLGFETDGIQLQPVADAATNLYDHSGWTFKCRDNWGAQNIHELAAGKSAGTWRATWSKIDDYRDQPKGKPLIHDDVFMRLWMVGGLDDTPRRSGFQPDSAEVIVGTAPAQRYFLNDDIGRTMKVVCVRRKNTDAVDNVVAVIEPYKDSSFIEDVRRLKVGGGNEYSVALAVDTVHGTDYFISYGGPDVPPEVTVTDGDRRIVTDADMAVVAYPAGDGTPKMLLAGGSYLTAGDHSLKLEGPVRFSGRLLEINDADDTLIIESSDSFPEGTALQGRPIIIQHREDRSSFTIKSITGLANDRYLIQLDDKPQLMSNWLLVKKVDADGIVVEPPPVLDAKHRTYKVYAGDRDNVRMLGRLGRITSPSIYNEYGTVMYRFHRVMTDDYTGLKPGQEIAITRLEEGVDTVFVTNYASATAAL